MGFLDFFRRKRALPANHEPPNFKILAKKTHFSTSELEVLHVRFLSLCNYNTGMIEKIPFVQQPELALNPIIDLAYDMECRHFMNLRMMIKKEKDDKKQLRLEELAMKTAEMLANKADVIDEDEEEEMSRKEQRMKRRRRRKKKNKVREGDIEGDGGGIGGGKESHEGSLESLDGLESVNESIESMDESLNSIDGDHVHSVILPLEDSLSGDSKEGNNIDQTPKDKVADKSDREIIDNDGDEIIKSDDQGDSEDNHSKSQSVDGKDKTNDEKKGEEGNHDNDKDVKSDNENVQETKNDSSSDSSSDGEASVRNKEKNIIVNADDTKNNGVAMIDGIDSTADNNQKDELNKNNASPPLTRVTSSFFRAQHRLKQLEEEKLQAGLPPDGIDFTHFVLLLSEFSPKASLSAKTSCKFTLKCMYYFI